MANRVKEEERNERIIRSLLKLPENRRCINCNSLGPQYVCTNFWTFVCTTCGGIHREFTHRVKSVSMAKFTSQEVSALQGGGNSRAKEIFFKECDPQRHSVPDSSNVERLRDFIKHVYVDRRYTGERSSDKPPRGKMGEVDDSNENRRVDAYQGGSRSPPYEDTYERRISDRPSPGGRSDDRNYRNNYDDRSPGYEQENRQYGDQRRSPAAEVVNDWRREDRFGNGRSPDRQKDLDMSSPPMVRPVRDILGDNVIPLRIEPPKTNGGRASDGSGRTQRTASSSSLASSNGNPAELRRENSGILIDFDAVAEPPIDTAIPQTQATTGQSRDQPSISSSADNWACFDSVTEAKVTQAASNVNSVESVLSQLSISASAPVAPASHMSASTFDNGAPDVNYLTSLAPSGVPASASVGNMAPPLFGGGASTVAQTNNLSLFPGGAPATAPGMASISPVHGANSFVKLAGEGQWPGMHTQSHSLFPATSNQFGAQLFTPPVGGASSNQPWNSSPSQNIQGPSSITGAQASQAAPKPALDVASGVVPQPSSVEVKPSGRKELPVDLFALYSSAPVPAPGWQSGAPHGFGFTVQSNANMPVPTFPQPARSTNPFDLNNDVSPVQASMFPSMVTLQGATPNVAASSGLLRTSSLNTPAQTWLPSQPPYQPAMRPRGPSYVSAMPSSMYMGQQVPNNLASSHQGLVGFSGEVATFGSLNSNEQLSRMNSAPATQNISLSGGNPFG